jgi:hypothetical protein
MRQCTVSADVEPLGFLLAVLAGQRRVTDSELGDASGVVRCELGLWHEGEHAAWVWDWPDRPSEALWARWVVDEPMRFESVPWCEVTSEPDGDACGLYLGHARSHSWDVSAPEAEALRGRLQAGECPWPSECAVTRPCVCPLFRTRLRPV